MNADFWHERWETDQLGFHQTRVNDLLTRFWERLEVTRDAPVFVPLCGKSLDMTWLRQRGHPIVGIELSPIAVRDFFAENGLPDATEIGAAPGSSVDLPPRGYASGGYTLYCGDFFGLAPEALAEVGAVYDRASLIAFPPELRARYAEQMRKLLPPSVSILLITIEYDQELMSGPPHSVPVAEIEALYGRDFEIETLWSSGDIAPTPRFQERGLDRWNEFVLRLERREQPR
jgi:thiopurine S-methyltransferase